MQVSKLMPFWQRHLILLRVCTLVCVILSPILVPTVVLINNFDEVKDTMKDIWKFLFEEYVDDRKDT